MWLLVHFSFTPSFHPPFPPSPTSTYPSTTHPPTHRQRVVRPGRRCISDRGTGDHRKRCRCHHHCRYALNFLPLPSPTQFPTPVNSHSNPSNFLPLSHPSHTPLKSCKSPTPVNPHSQAPRLPPPPVAGSLSPRVFPLPPVVAICDCKRPTRARRG